MVSTAAQHPSGPRSVLTGEIGVPCLPPVSWGYRHISRTPLYLHHGRLFHVPRTEAEHGVFDVDKEALDRTRMPDHPRGGHNYYGRDAEKIIRRIYWLDRMMSRKTVGWQEEYLAKITKLEQVKERTVDSNLAASPTQRSMN